MSETEEEQTDSAHEKRDIRAQISDMEFPDKLKLAGLGDGAARNILIFDSNKMISEAVLSNPKVKQAEIEEWAKNPNLSSDIIRVIGRNKEWTKSYPLKVSLVFNPKTPVDLSLRFVKFLLKNDLKKLSKSKNVPSAVMTVAKKRLSDMGKRR